MVGVSGWEQRCCIVPRLGSQDQLINCGIVRVILTKAFRTAYFCANRILLVFNVIQVPAATTTPEPREKYDMAWHCTWRVWLGAEMLHRSQTWISLGTRSLDIIVRVILRLLKPYTSARSGLGAAPSRTFPLRLLYGHLVPLFRKSWLQACHVLIQPGT